MNKRKSAIVTIICAAMLAVIVAALYKLLMVGFWMIVGALALYGFARCIVDFYRWLCRAEEPQPLEPVFPEEPSEDFVGTYDQIKEELRRENA